MLSIFLNIVSLSDTCVDRYKHYCSRTEMKQCCSDFVESAVLRIHDTNMIACCVGVIMLTHFVLPRPLPSMCDSCVKRHTSYFNTVGVLYFGKKGLDQNPMWTHSLLLSARTGTDLVRRLPVLRRIIALETLNKAVVRTSH